MALAPPAALGVFANVPRKGCKLPVGLHNPVVPIKGEEVLPAGAGNGATPTARACRGSLRIGRHSASTCRRLLCACRRCASACSGKREIRLLQRPRQHSHNHRQTHPLLYIANLD